MIIIVTGTSKGLGRQIAKVLISNGCEVIGISRTKSDINETNYTELNLDLSDLGSVLKVQEYIFKNNLEITALVNNAAFAYDELATNFSFTELDNMFRINVTIPIMLTKLCLRNFLANNIAGSIVNISSISAQTGYKGLSAYGASKAAIEGFSKGISREWGRLGIKSNCISPGFMKTSMSAGLSDEQLSKIVKRTSMRRDTSIEAVADLVCYLVIKNEEITGQVITIDNGTI